MGPKNIPSPAPDFSGRMPPRSAPFPIMGSAPGGIGGIEWYIKWFLGVHFADNVLA